MNTLMAQRLYQSESKSELQTFYAVSHQKAALAFCLIFELFKVHKVTCKITINSL